MNGNDPMATPGTPRTAGSQPGREEPETPSTERAPQTIRPAPGEAEPSRQVELGLMFTHSLMGETSRQALAAASSALALADLLIKAGVIEEEAFKAQREAVQAKLMELAKQRADQSGLGLFVNEEHEDKYALTDLPQIDCANRVHLCKAACCALRFPLSRQDVEEGIARWDFGRPYWNLRDRSGYCVHSHPETRGCQIYPSRPAPCRLYDCRQDRRIWLDFEAMIVNPDLEESLAAPSR